MKSNRKVLVLKYEDYYYVPAQRVCDIAEWLSVDLKPTALQDILHKTSIEQNMSNNLDFSHYDERTGLHGTHVNPVTRGEPGALLRSLDYDTDPFLISSSLKLLCKKFGYRL